LVLKVLRDLADHKDLKDLKGLKEHKVLAKELKVQQDQQGIQVLKA
jgi:hypothetical protein